MHPRHRVDIQLGHWLSEHIRPETWNTEVVRHMHGFPHPETKGSWRRATHNMLALHTLGCVMQFDDLRNDSVVELVSVPATLLCLHGKGAEAEQLIDDVLEPYLFNVPGKTALPNQAGISYAPGYKLQPATRDRLRNGTTAAAINWWTKVAESTGLEAGGFGNLTVESSAALAHSRNDLAIYQHKGKLESAAIGVGGALGIGGAIALMQLVGAHEIALTPEVEHLLMEAWCFVAALVSAGIAVAVHKFTPDYDAAYQCLRNAEMILSNANKIHQKYANIISGGSMPLRVRERNGNVISTATALYQSPIGLTTNPTEWLAANPQFESTGTGDITDRVIHDLIYTPSSGVRPLNQIWLNTAAVDAARGRNIGKTHNRFPLLDPNEFGLYASQNGPALIQEVKRFKPDALQRLALLFSWIEHSHTINSGTNQDGQLRHGSNGNNSGHTAVAPVVSLEMSRDGLGLPERARGVWRMASDKLIAAPVIKLSMLNHMTARPLHAQIDDVLAMAVQEEGLKDVAETLALARKDIETNPALFIIVTEFLAFLEACCVKASNGLNQSIVTDPQSKEAFQHAIGAISKLIRRNITGMMHEYKDVEMITNMFADQKQTGYGVNKIEEFVTLALLTAREYPRNLDLVTKVVSTEWQGRVDRMTGTQFMWGSGCIYALHELRKNISDPNQAELISVDPNYEINGQKPIENLSIAIRKLMSVMISDAFTSIADITSNNHFQMTDTVKGHRYARKVSALIHACEAVAPQYLNEKEVKALLAKIYQTLLLIQINIGHYAEPGAVPFGSMPDYRNGATIIADTKVRVQSPRRYMLEQYCNVIDKLMGPYETSADSIIASYAGCILDLTADIRKNFIS